MKTAEVILIENILNDLKNLKDCCQTEEKLESKKYLGLDEKMV